MPLRTKSASQHSREIRPRPDCNTPRSENLPKEQRAYRSPVDPLAQYLIKLKSLALQFHIGDMIEGDFRLSGVHRSVGAAEVEGFFSKTSSNGIHRLIQ